MARVSFSSPVAGTFLPRRHPAPAWNGEYDAIALYVLGGVSQLLSTVTEGYERVSMHGVSG